MSQKCMVELITFNQKTDKTVGIPKSLKLRTQTIYLDSEKGVRTSESTRNFLVDQNLKSHHSFYEKSFRRIFEIIV